MNTRRAITVGLCLGLGSLACVAVANASAPTITSLPAVNSPTVVADDATPYIVSTTATDPNGYNDIRCIRLLANFTEAGGDQSYGRGVMAWGKTDGDIAQ